MVNKKSLQYFLSLKLRNESRSKQRDITLSLSNKKGIIRIIEAVIAVLIILGAFLLISSQRESRTAKNIGETLPSYLDEVAKNSSLRKLISEDYNLSEQYNSTNNLPIVLKLEDFVGKKIGESYNYTVRICDLNRACEFELSDQIQREIFSAERIISTTPDKIDFEMRKVKLFLWKKQGAGE